MSEIEEPGLLKTGIRVIQQRYCLKCGKILPTEIKRNFVHNCEKPDFLLWGVNAVKRQLEPLTKQAA